MTDELEASGSADEVTDAPDPAATDRSRWARWREHRRNRISKWDRPPDPHDWRFFVGNLGKVLIATGILLFGFVAYQLWGTGIETARAQSQLEDEFQERIAAAAVADEEPEVGFDTWVLPDEPATTTPDDAGDDDTTAGDGPRRVTPQSLEEVEISDLVPGGLDLSDFAVDQDVPIVPGDSFARLDIPKIGVSEYVVPGVKLTDLKRGPGHYPETPLPGQLGNASIAGHRTTYGAPFFDLDLLAAGDEIEVTMVTGDRFVYRVTGLEIVSASDYWVVTTRDPNVAELTLTTCDPKYTARDRLVVHSVLVPEKSAQVGEAEFYQLDDTGDDVADDEPIPGDDPTFETDATADDDTDAIDRTTDATAGDDDIAPSTTESLVDGDAATGTDDEPTVDTAGGAADQPVREEATPATTVDTGHADEADDLEEIDAFSQGWFDDGDAWPQIALWGIALTIISLLAYQVSKKTRHDSIGFLVGIGPFLFCLYFFFQNVNRLLPPGL